MAIKERAAQMVGEAIRKGFLVRPDVCERCKADCFPIAHHEDYDRPLEVVWLCRSCHGGLHRRRKISGEKNSHLLYIVQADRDVWERAQRYARDHGVSLSSLVAEALEHYLTTVAG